MNATIAQLQQVTPKAPTPWLEALLDLAPKHGIDTPNELASFIAQLAHESNGLTQFEESLNYTPQAALSIFNRTRVRITPEEAQLYCRTSEHAANQAMIANIVYENMLENGSRATGDGWANRGMGPIQITGRRNRRLCQEATGMPLVKQPDLLLKPEAGIMSAIWFWKVNGLDALDDDESAAAESRRVNGGDIGILHRQQLLDKALHALRT